MSADLDVVRSHYAASDRGDLPGMLAVLAPDVRWTEAAGFPLAGTYVGPDAVADGVFRRLQQDWKGFALTVDEVLDAGSRIIGVGTYRGTSPTTGKSFEARVVHLWTVRDGKAIAFEQVADSALVEAATR